MALNVPDAPVEFGGRHVARLRAVHGGRAVRVEVPRDDRGDVHTVEVTDGDPVGALVRERVARRGLKRDLGCGEGGQKAGEAEGRERFLFDCMIGFLQGSLNAFEALVGENNSRANPRNGPAAC
ncbi:MAG: hypothetical protein GY711_13655 [bacterium]|nr:hypothetical protein [bacterium]